MHKNRIRVGHASFSVADEHHWLAQDDTDGAVVTFTGKVRAQRLDGQQVSALTLEHYPGMTEKSLTEIVHQAREHWAVQRVCVIHRTGELVAGDDIVFVGVSSTHRAAAFAAAEFIMDHLKTRAPFWKRETTAEGTHWVQAKKSDEQATRRW